MKVKTNKYHEPPETKTPILGARKTSGMPLNTGATDADLFTIRLRVGTVTDGVNAIFLLMVMLTRTTPARKRMWIELAR